MRLRCPYTPLVHAMSALPPKADILQRHSDVRFVPEADIGQRQSITSSPIAIACHNRYWDISRESTPDRSRLTPSWNLMQVKHPNQTPCSVRCAL